MKCLSAMLSLLALGAAPPQPVVLEGASLVLPEGWAVVRTEAAGTTFVASFPTLDGRAEGEVLLQAAAPTGQGSLFVVRVPAPLEASEGVKDALAVSAPEAFRRLWGVDYRVVWAGLVDVGGSPTVQVQGAFAHDGLPYTSLTALVPGGPSHYVLGYTVPSEGQRLLPAVSASLATFSVEADPPGPWERELPRGLVGATAGALVGLGTALTLGLWRRRRRAP